MLDFLNSLYSYEYFGFYLIISIIVLVLLFLIILFFGKKDKKKREIEATKKLQQLNSEAFKEESVEQKVEVNEELANTIIVPTIEDIPSINNVEVSEEIPEPVLPISEEVSVPSSMEVEEKKEEQPLLEKIEEKPFAFDNTGIFNTESIIEPMPNEEKVVEEVEVPEFNFDEIIKDVEEVKNVEMSEPVTKGPEVFSSVYVPEPKVEVKEVEVKEMEMPAQKEKEELDFELPSLKRKEPEVKEELPELKDYNLDDLSGETYIINK